MTHIKKNKVFLKNALMFYFKRQGVLMQMPWHFENSS